MSSDSNQKVKEYKDSLMKKAEHLVIEEFPKRIVELNELLLTPMFSECNFNEVHQELNIPFPDPILANNHETVKTGESIGEPASKPFRTDTDTGLGGSKVLCLPNSKVDCNERICDMIKVVKPIIRKLVEDSNLLKMWISYMVPKIEDGNNFGVSVQMNILGKIHAVEAQAAAFFDDISQYSLSRAEVVSKVAKYPFIDDYRRAINELDETEHFCLHLLVCGVRNRYSSLHDIVIKNMEKLKTPRSSNTENLY